jgi:hypothetical protein
VLRADHELSAHKGQLTVDVHGLIGVNVDQFFGIEIEEFPAQIAQVAMAAHFDEYSNQLNR